MDDAEFKIRSQSQDSAEKNEIKREESGINQTIPDVNQTAAESQIDEEFGEPLLNSDGYSRDPLQGNFSLSFIQKTLRYNNKKVKDTAL
jgi:hypothetical protein